VIHGLDQGQKHFPGDRDLHFVQEALATCPFFGVDLLFVREAQLERDSHPVQFQFENWSDFSWFFRGSLIQERQLTVSPAWLMSLSSLP
jgi:hypothetical protein